MDMQGAIAEETGSAHTDKEGGNKVAWQATACTPLLFDTQWHTE